MILVNSKSDTILVLTNCWCRSSTLAIAKVVAFNLFALINVFLNIGSWLLFFIALHKGIALLTNTIVTVVALSLKENLSLCLYKREIATTTANGK